MDELLRLLDESRAGEARAARGRERLLRTAEEEGATLSGTLLDLAERALPVLVRTVTGRQHLGAIRLVAADFVVVAATTGEVWLASSAVASVQPTGGTRHPAATGDRPALDLLLVEALGRLAPSRPAVALVLAGGEVVRGQLRAVGVDVVTLQADGEGRGPCYVSASAIREVFRSG